MSASDRTIDERALFSPPSRPVTADELDFRSGGPLPRAINRSKSVPWRWKFHAGLSGRLVSHLRQALRTEADYATPFLFAPVFLGTGALIYSNSATEPEWMPILFGIVAISLILVLARRQMMIFYPMLAVLLVVSGMLVGKVETWRSATKMLGSAVTSTVTGTVAAIERQSATRARLVIDIDETARPLLKYAPDRVRIVARGLPEGLVPGVRISGRARLIPPSGPVLPRGYDFAFNNYFDGLGAVGFFLGAPRIIADDKSTAWFRPAIWLEQVRDGLSARIRARIGGSEGEIAAALIAGAKQGIPEEINEALRRTGLAHILSISGLHMALVAGTVIAVLRLAFALFPQFASRHPVRKYAAVMALGTVFLYLFVSGTGIATQRSFLMLAVMLLALLHDRPAITMRNLAIAAIIVISLHPHEVAGPSFQMSFAATAALVGAYSAWSARRARRAAAGIDAQRSSNRAGAGLVRKLAGYTLALAMTSLIAGSATGIYGAWHFHRLAPLGLFANLAAMPIVSLLVMPSAVIGVALTPFDLDGPAFALMGKAIGMVLAVAFWFSERSPLDVVGIVPVESLLAATMGLVMAALPVTWLRWCCLPFFAAAIWFADGRALPEVLISEDGRMVAVVRADGELAVNRARPRAFTLEIWMKAVAANSYQRPRPHDDPLSAVSAGRDSTGIFHCNDDLCAFRHPGGALVVHAKTELAALPACSSASLMVIESAVVGGDPCAGKRRSNSTVLPVIITARELAHRGAAEAVFRSAQGEGKEIEPAHEVSIDYAVSKPWRSWHEHRAFSREARGLPPYRRKSGSQARRAD